jgi:hypothetical protein
MNARLFGLATAIAILSISPASAVTYNYVGNAYTTNPDPADFGSNMTGSVTFSCNPCSDGTYLSTGGVITNLQLTSGIYTSSLPNFFANFTIESNAIVEWQIFQQVYTVSALASVGSTDPNILAQLQSHAAPPSTGVADEVVQVTSSGIGNVVGVVHSSGAWSEQSAVGAPLSNFGEGMPGLVSLGGGLLLYWLKQHRRRRAS